MDELLTPREICQKYRISIFTLYKWTALGTIPCVRIGKTLRFRKDILLEWEEQQKSTVALTTKLL